MLDPILELLDPRKECAIIGSIEGKTSEWLSVLPVAYHHFDISTVEFHDPLALCYRKSLVRMPESCDVCGESFTLCHALDCRKDGSNTTAQ